MVVIFRRLISIMLPRNPTESPRTVRFTNVARLAWPALSFAMSLLVPFSARANSVCGSGGFAPEAGLCSSMSMLDRISGIEGLEINFFGSQAASDMEIAFKNVSYYSSYTPKPKASKDQSSATSTGSGFGDGVWPGSGNTSTTGGSSGSNPSFSSDSASFNQPLPSEIVKADLVSGTPNLPTDLNAVPEPRFFGVELLIAGLAIGIWLKLRQGRRVL